VEFVSQLEQQLIGSILNRMIGTGIFATPSGIFALSGSVGLALFMWVAGTLIAFAGLLVYIEFGTAIPRNGGEKNYLEFVYRRPRFLATGFFTSYVMLLGWAGELISPKKKRTNN
jgi:amino acid transporter